MPNSRRKAAIKLFEIMNDPNTLPTPAEMTAYLDRFVRGQTRAKRDLAVAVYNHYLARALRERDGEDLGRHHLLMIGPTGVGKSYLVRTLGEFLGVPVGFSSATSLVEAGYKGSSVESVESVVRALLDRAGGDARKAEKGIVFLDEIDKIRRGETGGRDVSGEGVQNALLTLLDGRVSDGEENSRHAGVDTGKLLFVCTGAFVGLEEIVKARLGRGKRAMGFHTVGDKAAETRGLLEEAQTADLVAYGMIPEFIGRFATLSVLHSLSRDDLRAIAGAETERSPLSRQQKLARVHGIELVLTDDALDAIAREAEELGTGARGLHRLIGKAVDGVDYRWPELAADGVTRVEIGPAAALGRENTSGVGEPLLIKGERIHECIDEELRRESLQGLLPRPRPVIRESTESGITDVSGWTEEAIWNRLEEIKAKLGWPETTGSARKWWETFETENRHRPALVLRLCDELKKRKSTIGEFFLSYVYSNTDNIQANLHYLDYRRLKEAEEKKPE